MNNLDDLTVIILTYNTPEKILSDCLDTIDKNVNVLIVENSIEFQHKEWVTKNFPKIKIICTGENLGYGRGNNYGIQHASTNYILILNPDLICDKKFFSNILEVTNEAKDFSIIGCQYLHDKIFMPAGFFDRKKNREFSEKFRNNKIDSLSRVEWVTGCSILLNLKKFKNKEVFDKNFFLYFEEFDLCKSLTKIGEKIYTSSKLKIHHLGFKSSLGENYADNLKKINMKNWHYMWSSFYFYKKNYNFFYALGKIWPNFFRSLSLFIKSQIKKDFENSEYAKAELSGILNSIINKKSFYRPKIF